MFGGVNIGQADPTGNVSSPSSTSTSYMPLSSMMANLTMSVRIPIQIYFFVVHSTLEPGHGCDVVIYQDQDCW